jgi:hypothetical protein
VHTEACNEQWAYVLLRNNNNNFTTTTTTTNNNNNIIIIENINADIFTENYTPHKSGSVAEIYLFFTQQSSLSLSLSLTHTHTNIAIALTFPLQIKRSSGTPSED